MLRDVSKVDIKTRILGQEVAFPVCVGATAMQKMAHIEGEIASCRGLFIVFIPIYFTVCEYSC